VDSDGLYDMQSAVIPFQMVNWQYVNVATDGPGEILSSIV
jgi:hypothetical protein